MSVSTLVLLGLAVVWAIVLLPEALKRIAKVRHGDSIRSFNRQLSSLQGPTTRSRPIGGSNVIDLRTRSNGSGSSVRPQRPQPASAAVPFAVRRRRQEVLTVLGSASVLTLLCTIAFGGPFVMLFLVSAGLLVAYVVALHQVTNAPPITARNVHQHPARTSTARRSTEVAGVRVSPVGARRVAN